MRAIIDAAAEVYVVTPSLPGRLAWLADDVDRFRHIADERLDTVLGQMRSIRGHVSGDALRGSVMTVITDGVETFRPDHILLALRSSAHANWQEHGLVEHVEQRFGLPLTTFAIDPEGHMFRRGGSASHGLAVKPPAVCSRRRGRAPCLERVIRNGVLEGPPRAVPAWVSRLDAGPCSARSSAATIGLRTCERR